MLTNTKHLTILDKAPFKMQLKEGITFSHAGDNKLSLKSQQSTRIIEGLSPSICEALISISFAPQSKNSIGEKVIEKEGFGALSRLLYEISNLEINGLLEYYFTHEDTILCSIENMINGAIPFQEVNDLQSFKLSRFAFLRTENQSMILETSKDSIKIKIRNPQILNFIHHLAGFTTIEELTKKCVLNESLIRGLLSLLSSGSFLTFEDQNNSITAQSYWNFHDHLFHNRSRYGKHNYPSGGTYRFIGKSKPKKARRDIDNSLKDIFLDVPSEIDLANSNSLNSCIESRVSTREFEGIELSKLSTFLYRCCRIKGTQPMQIQNHKGEKEVVETLRTPYPSGGALYELGFYLTVSECEGLEPGFYYYNPFEHKLSLLSQPSQSSESMVWYARMCTNMPLNPPVVITLSADFERMFWKYENMAYAAILKNVGAVFQTMYLVATDLGLGACAMGNGNTEVFKNITGKSKMEESSVGEFIIGNPVKEKNHAK